MQTTTEIEKLRSGNVAQECRALFWAYMAHEITAEQFYGRLAEMKAEQPILEGVR
jgi:hypothetical protein